jgi:hypothetical protein
MKLPEAGNNPVFPAGTYKVRIESFEFTKASTGTKQILWKARIEEPEAHEGRTLSTYTALTEAAIWKVSNLIGACGVNFEPNAIDTDKADFVTLCNLTKGRTSYWLNADGTDNKGLPRNNIVKFEMDLYQDPISFTKQDDSPFGE